MAVPGGTADRSIAHRSSGGGMGMLKEVPMQYRIVMRQALFGETDCSVTDDSGAHVAHFSVKVGGYR